MTVRTKKVVLIEDSDTDAFLIMRSFRDYPCAKSYSVVRFGSMAEAEAFFSKESDDVELVLLDLNLPDTCGGHDTYARLQKILPSVPVVVLTSTQNHELALELLSEGVEDFVNKGNVLDHPEYLCRAIDFSICRSGQYTESMNRLSRELDIKARLMSHMTNL